MKYPLLNNPDWLHKEYVDNKNSTVKLAKMVGCSVRAIGSALVKFGIKARDSKESRALQRQYSFKHEQLNDRDWVYQKYIVEQLSTQNIADLIGAVSGNSVRQALQRHGLEIRNRSVGQTINREDDHFIFNQSVIEGCLLGDGSLDIWNKESNISIPFFHKKNINYDHVKFVADKIFSQKSESRIKKYTHPNGYQHYSVSTLTHNEFSELFKRWYPESNGYKKIIPEDIQIDRELLLHVFLDDGCAYWRRPQSKTKQIVITLSLQCFEKENQQMLCDKINKIYGLKLQVERINSGTGFRIKIPQSQTGLFYEIIGRPPVPSLAYKWK